MRVLFIDNFDSFTYNLVDEFQKRNCEVIVYRNNVDMKIIDAVVKKFKPKLIVISPGPGSPKKAGISNEIIQKYHERIPIFGVCLGHQSIAAAFGGNIIRADQVVHGKTSSIYHDGKTIFQGIEKGFTATRYHSLIVKRETLPDCFEISAWTEDNIIMGLRHRTMYIEGVQFHPESILTDVGKNILKNFLGN